MASTDTIAPGYTIRAQQPDDFSRIADFLWRYDMRVSGFSDFTEEELRELDRHPRSDRAKDTWVVEDGDAVVGYARLWEEDEGRIVECFGAVDPDHTQRGIGSFLVAKQEIRARERLRHGHGLVLRTFVDVKDEPGRQLLADAGFRVVRRHYTMLGSLTEDVGSVAAPDGITLRNAVLDEAKLVHELLEDVFAQHWGHVPQTYDEWGEMVLKRGDLEPALWFIAEEGSEPVGILLANVQDRRGWVADLGVRSPWRRRGIARWMLTRCFAEFRRRGLTEAGLGVDATNESGAVALYESVGMRAAKAFESREKTLS